MRPDTTHPGGRTVPSPLIGIPGSNKDESFVLRKPYARAIAEAGGLPVILPLIHDEGLLCSLYARLDGLLFSGGGDLSPAHYGGEDNGRLNNIDPERDAVELLLARWALAEGKPVLGICRGIQLLNVAAGGTLIQDIPSQFPGALAHWVRASGHRPAHEVELVPGTLLADILLAGKASRPLGVNSRHHQAVCRVAPEFVVSARAPDGIIEGLERPQTQGGFAVGVQWHPEDLVPGDLPMERLFRRFVAACGR